MITLFEIVIKILIALILILNGHDYLLGMCFGICYMSGIYFTDNDLNECFEKLEVILKSVKCREEKKKKSL